MDYRNTIIVVSCILTLLFTSCDPYVDYKQIIDNQSDYQMLIIAKNSTVYAKDTFILAPRTQMEIYIEGEIAVNKEYVDCKVHADSMIVVIDSLHHLNFDLGKSSNWNYRIIEGKLKSGGKCECVAIIKNENID